MRGTAKYRVRVRLRGSKLLASCSCPYFGPQGEPCKHLWATLLLADSRGLLQSPPVFPVRLVVEGPRRPPPTGLPEVRDAIGRLERRPPYPLDSDLGVIGLGPPRPSAGRPVRPAARGPGSGRRTAGVRGEPLGDAGGWSQRGRGPSPRDRRAKAKSAGPGPGSSGPARAPARGAAAKAVNRNGKRLLVYVLDVAATLAQNQVVIDLARRQRKTTGEWGPLRPWYYAPGPPTSSTTPKTG